MKYKHLFFDLDHTLWDFDTNAGLCIEEMYHEFDLKSKGIPTFDDFLGSYNQHNAALWRGYEKGNITSTDLKWKRMWQTILDFKIADRALANAMSDFYIKILPLKEKVYDHTYDVLEYLKEKGYQLNVLTNGFETTQRGKLESSHLTNYFDHIITSESANSAKPQVEIYRYAMDKAAADVDNSLMLGDNLEADIAGAVNVGMDSVFVNLSKREVQHKATYEIRKLEELEELL